MEGAAVDEVVRRLVEGSRGGRQVQLSEAEIRQLCVEGKRVLLSQPNLLRIHAPVKIWSIAVIGSGSFGYKYKTIGFKYYLFTSRSLIAALIASMNVLWCYHLG